MDRTGRVLSRITAPTRIQSFALSPDEKRLLLRIGHGGGDLWLQDLHGGNLTRFTSSGKVDTTQVWSPDGRYVLYAERPNSLESHLYRKPTDGSTKEELLADLSHETSADDWSRDGKYLLIRNSQATAPKLLLFPADSVGHPLSFSTARRALKVPDLWKWKTPEERASISANGPSGRMDIGRFVFLRMHRSLNGKVMLEDELQRIYDSEINVSISWLWDGGIDVRLGDEMNGYLAEESVSSTGDILPWLQESIAHFYPH